MKRTTLAVFSLLLTTAAFGADTRRYLVATTTPMRSGGLAVAVNRAPADVQPRNVVRFDSVDGFAADLTEAEVEALRQSDGVRLVEPVVERHAFDVSRSIGAQTTPYGVGMVRAPLAWKARNAGDVHVVVMDTGVDYRHPDLAYAYRGGIDLVNQDNDPLDDHGHGTHVSGTIVAKNDDQGVVGVAPGMSLYAIKVLNAQGKGNSENLVKALDWIEEKKASEGGRWVVNLSLGSAEASEVERLAFTKAVDLGIIVVAASGNSSTTAVPAAVQYPAAYPGMIAVGAVNEAKVVTSFSCQGPELAFTAPGMAILSTVRVGTDEISYIVNAGSAVQTMALEGSRKGEFTGQFVFVGLGKEGEITPQKVGGKIALIRRGEITFAEKAKRAKEAGAAAVVIFNNESPYTRWTMLSDDDPSSYTYDWPLTLSLPQAEGDALATKGTGTLKVAYTFDDYGEKSGTSMAAPHVAGVVAFLWSIAPTATSGALLNALTTTAIDLGSAGKDPVYGYGLVDVHAAARLLAPGAFTEPEPLPGRPTTGRRFLRR
ncbi:MAG TPA: S8 family serine peptidase [Thermoanaerobaculia bacterium]